MADRTPLPAPGRAREAALRQRRRAEALRENLRRRKEQAKSRDGVAEPSVVEVDEDQRRS